MTPARVPPHHVQWESESEWQSHPHAELAPPPDGRVRAPWTRVLALGAGAFAVWFLLFAPTLQHNAQVSPVGTRRTVSLDVVGPVAALSRALGLSHIVSVTGRGNGLASGSVGLTSSGPPPHDGPRPPGVGTQAGARWRERPPADDGAAEPQAPDRGESPAGPDRR